MINSANSCKIMFNNDFTGCEIMYDCMALILTHCPFNRELHGVPVEEIYLKAIRMHY